MFLILFVTTGVGNGIEQAEGDPQVLGRGAEHLGQPPNRIWSRCTPSSHTGYQMPSATSLTSR